MNKLLISFLSLTLLAGCSEVETLTPSSDVDPQDEAPQAETPVEAEVKETINEDGSYTFTVLLSGEALASIEKEAPVDGYDAYVFDQANDKLYIAVDPTGLGGYILYGGAFELYEVSLETGAVRQIAFEGQATDVSPDGRQFVYMLGNEIGERFIVLADTNPGGEFVTFQVSEEFDQAGDGTFNFDGSKFAYQATITSDGSEETAVFVVDVATGEQMEFARQGGLFEIVWQDNNRPIAD